MIEPQRNKIIKERKIKMDMDKIYKAAGFIATTIVSIGISQMIELLPNANGVVNTIVIVALALVCCYLIIKLHDDKANSNEKFNSETQKYEKEMNDLKDKVAEYEKRLEDSEKMSEVFDIDKGGAYLLMSLTQNLNEPLKIKYLEKAAKEYRNELASLFLANLYSSGIEKNGVILLEQNREKAANIYHDMVDGKIDKHGVASWQLGCYYEKNLTEEARELPDNEARFREAFKFYEKSSEKGFGKARNSLAVFYRSGLGGVNTDTDKADDYYKEACDYGDVYALVNRGHLSLQQYKEAKTPDIRLLDSAQKSFENAAKFDNNEAYYQLGQVYSIRADGETDIAVKYGYIEKAAYSYIQAFSKVNNVYSASAYYQLGKLINASLKLENAPSNLTKDQKVLDALRDAKFEDLAAECLMRAYEQFEKIDKSRLGYKYGLVYQELKNSISKCL